MPSALPRSPSKILIFGASYGSLLGIKAALAGHDVTLICQPATAQLFNAEGAIVRLPIKGHADLVEIRSAGLKGQLRAASPGEVDPKTFDLVALAMQEPQYAASGVRELLDRTAMAGVPTISLMNMPPLPYLARLPGLDVSAYRDCYADASVWDRFDPGVLTLCSPDPQAFRPADEPANVLQVRLATNFKAAAFASAEHTALLRALEADIDAVRIDVGGVATEVPVKLRVSQSLYVPLAKWAMLLAGNYRCVETAGMRSICDAVHSDPARARTIYEWVVELCIALGADQADLVAFDKYAEAARALRNPSSAARALASGATAIERVDKLVQTIGAQKGHRSQVLDETVAAVDGWLAKNKQAQG